MPASAQVISSGPASCAILSDGSLKCWGFNTDGGLGLGDTEHRGDNTAEMRDNLPAVDLGTGRTATAVRSSFAHTCAILDNGSLKCWGRNSLGHLGQGDTNNRGDNSNEMGDNLPAIDLGTSRTAQAIAGGLYNSTCALLDDNSIKCWGHNSFGQLGLEDTNHRGDAPNEMGDNLPTVKLSSAAIPVELATFEATADGPAVVLRWSTASETNNAGFDVQQRDARGSTWRTLSFVEGQGTTNEPQAYRYRATELEPGRHTFRLK